LYHDWILQVLFKKWKVSFVNYWYWIKIAENNEPVVSLLSKQRKPYEILIIGSFGEPENNVDEKIIFCQPTKHSQKPPLVKEFREIMKNDSMECLEIFARNLNSNCVSWGNEVLKFQDLNYFERKSDLNNCN
jgi:N(6)-adenine-specific DNA methyltransferase